MNDVAAVIREAVSALRAAGDPDLADRLAQALERLRGARPVIAWAVSWYDGGVRRLQTFQRRDIALAWLDDRRICNPGLEAALVFPLFEGADAVSDDSGA